MNLNDICGKWIVVGLLVVNSEVTWAKNWDFKGLELGKKSSVAELEKNYSLKCQPVVTGQYCHGTTTLLDWPAELNVNLDVNDFVFKISVPYQGDPLKQFDSPKAIIAKYGQPTKKSGVAYEWIKRTNISFWKIFFDPSKLELSVYRMDKPLPSNPAMTVNPKAKTDL